MTDIKAGMQSCSMLNQTYSLVFLGTQVDPIFAQIMGAEVICTIPDLFQTWPKPSPVPCFLLPGPLLEAKNTEASGRQSHQMEKAQVPKQVVLCMVSPSSSLAF